MSASETKAAEKVARAGLASHPSDGPSDVEMLDEIERLAGEYAAGGFYATRVSDGTYTVIVGGVFFGPAPTLRDAIRQAMGSDEQA